MTRLLYSCYSFRLQKCWFWLHSFMAQLCAIVHLYRHINNFLMTSTVLSSHATFILWNCPNRNCAPLVRRTCFKYQIIGNVGFRVFECLTPMTVVLFLNNSIIWNQRRQWKVVGFIRGNQQISQQDIANERLLLSGISFSVLGWKIRNIQILKHANMRFWYWSSLKTSWEGVNYFFFPPH